MQMTRDESYHALAAALVPGTLQRTSPAEVDYDGGDHASGAAHMVRSKWLLWVTVIAAGTLVGAQSGRTFKARLSPVPIDVTMQATVAGSGSVSAVLTGAKLAITGNFEGLRSPATIAQVHKSPVRGVRGPVVFDITASKGTSGTISGSLDLTPLQVTDLEKGRLYIQVHSEKAPEGNLWGWLLIQEGRR
jgi:CHRD domain